ncbi:hypothetical protein BJ944DRAFT_274106 [Cunninghamella echinulata]|nr:hypothetical protein BJ944DRAFT_274106 [Cunninghamella echinulata]
MWIFFITSFNIFYWISSLYKPRYIIFSYLFIKLHDIAFSLVIAIAFKRIEEKMVMDKVK